MPVATYRLETFGKLALSGGASAGLSHQRRRLALLALLAASGERGVSRDQLLAYLWPESPAANARHSLEQLLHALRRALGESVFSGVNPVYLNSEVVASDVSDFEGALARGALAEAVALYDGPFLSGFYLEDAPEFERWTSTERARLADRYTEALGRLAVDAESAGDHAAAVRWRRRIADADPVSSRSALALMRALAAAGDKTSALQHARIYEALVQQELDSAADPSIAKYAAALRSGGDQTAPSEVLPITSVPLDRLAAELPPLAAPVSTESALPTVEEARVEEQRSEEAIAGRRNYWWPVGIFLGVTILLVAMLSGRHRENGPTLDLNKIVIVPFRTSGVDSSVKYLGEGVVDLIAPMLTGEGGPIAVDSRTAISTWNRVTHGREGTAEDARHVARELGAGLVLTGAVVEVGGRLTITGNIISGNAGETRPLSSVTAPIDSVDTLLDRFVGQLLTRRSGVPETSVSAVTSQSLPAIRAYLNGRAAYRRADEGKAIESFTRALDIDSTFALAALDLAVATGKLLRTEVCRNTSCRVLSIVPGFVSSDRQDDLFRRGLALAWEYRLKLGRRDRPLLEALRGQNYPRESSARETLANLERALRAAPDRPETHYLLGTLLLYQGAALGMPNSTMIAEAAFRTASKLDSSYLAPLARMVDAAAFVGDTAKLRRAAVLYLSRDTTGPSAEYVRWLLAVGAADVAAQRTIRARFRSLNQATLEHIYLTGQMSGMGLDDVDRAAALLIENATDALEKSVAFRIGELLALNRGRRTEGTNMLRRMDELRLSGSNFRWFAIVGAMFNDGDRAVADSSARDLARTLARDTLRLLSRDMMRLTSASMTVQSLWYLAAGDTAHAMAAASWLRRHAEGQPRNGVLLVLPEMLIASRARRPEGAALRALVDSVTLDGCCEIPDFVMLVLARAYEESGDVVGALRVIRRGIWFHPPRQLSTHLREEGRLAASLGDRAAAIRAYEHYLALRSDPEPVLRAQRDSIRAEVNRLKHGR